MAFDYQQAADRVRKLLDASEKIVVIQGDNPDGDSLASALAIENILGDAGKSVYLYCGIDIPEHLKFISGWDRVLKEVPSKYDVAIVVDCGVWSLLGNHLRNGGRRFAPEKLIVIDEHDVQHDIASDFDMHDVDAVSSGQIIYELFTAASYKFSTDSATLIAASLLADTLGLTSDVLVNRPRPFEIMAQLVSLGYNPAELQEKRLERLKVSAETLSYRGELLQRVEYFDEGKISSITIPYDEIRGHSQEFNPTVILDETRMVEGVLVSIGFKQYVKDNKLVRVTGRIRCNRTCQIADKLAQAFGGGGHVYAAGFKVEGDDINFEDLKNQVIAKSIELMKNVNSKV